MKLTNRGWFALGMVAALALWCLFQVAVHLWFTDAGYCWGTMTECYR